MSEKVPRVDKRDKSYMIAQALDWLSVDLLDFVDLLFFELLARAVKLLHEVLFDFSFSPSELFSVNSIFPVESESLLIWLSCLSIDFDSLRGNLNICIQNIYFHGSIYRILAKVKRFLDLFVDLTDWSKLSRKASPSSNLLELICMNVHLGPNSKAKCLP